MVLGISKDDERQLTTTDPPVYFEILELGWQSLPEAFVWDQLKLMRSRDLDVTW